MLKVEEPSMRFIKGMIEKGPLLMMAKLPLPQMGYIQPMEKMPTGCVVHVQPKNRPIPIYRGRKFCVL